MNKEIGLKEVASSKKPIKFTPAPFYTTPHLLCEICGLPFARFIVKAICAGCAQNGHPNISSLIPTLDEGEMEAFRHLNVAQITALLLTRSSGGDAKEPKEFKELNDLLESAKK